MSSFIVDESKFMISDEESNAFFTSEYKLASGIVIGELEDESDSWQLYISADGRHYILAVLPELHDKWVASRLLKDRDFECIEVDSRKIYLLFSSSVHRVTRLTNIRINKSLRYAYALFSAFIHTRQLDLDSNLRDGLYFESRSVILPTYSLVGNVSDRCLFENALRGKNDPEKLTAPDGLNDSVSYFYFRKCLTEHGFTLNKNEPLFETGEIVDDFLLGEESNSMITAPLIIRDHYQLFDTTSDSYILMIDSLWGEALISSNIVNQIQMNSFPINSKRYFVLSFKKDQIIECMNDRHGGLNKENAFELTEAIRRTRTLLPECDLTSALYIQKLGYLLPEKFTNADNTNDRDLLVDCLTYGPFAMAPLMDDINHDLVTILVHQ